MSAGRDPAVRRGAGRWRWTGTGLLRADDGYTVRARFVLSETPVVEVRPAPSAAAHRAAAEALAAAGRAYLGGRLVLRASGRPPRGAAGLRAAAAAQRRAATLAVESALRGGPGRAAQRAWP